MPEIRGSLSRDGTVKGTCCWCGTSSTSSGIAPGMGGVEIPLHVLCAAAIIRAFRLWQERGIDAPPWALRGLSDYAGRVQEVRMLTPGVG